MLKMAKWEDVQIGDVVNVPYRVRGEKFNRFANAVVLWKTSKFAHVEFNVTETEKMELNIGKKDVYKVC